MIGEKSVPIDEVELALAWVGEAEGESVGVLRRVQAEQVIQPALDRVSLAVPNWLI